MSSSGTFVNQGLKRWESIRAEWVSPPPGQAAKPKREVKAKEVELEDVIERIFEQGFGGELPQPLALGQMEYLKTGGDGGATHLTALRLSRHVIRLVSFRTTD